MNIQVRLEDTYGITYMAFSSVLSNSIEYLRQGIIKFVDNQGNNVSVVYGLSSSRMFSRDFYDENADVIIFVYDMDKLGIQYSNITGDEFFISNEPNYNILGPIALKNKVEKYKERAKNDMIKRCGTIIKEQKLRFIPVPFCAETIGLYLVYGVQYGQILSNGTKYGDNYGMVFSAKNTAELHRHMLKDIIMDGINSNHPRFSGIPAKWGIKKTETWYSCAYSIHDTWKNIQEENVFLKSMFVPIMEWLCGDAVFSGNNTYEKSPLLNEEEAIQYQRDYFLLYEDFIRRGRNTYTIGGRQYNTIRNEIIHVNISLKLMVDTIHLKAYFVYLHIV